MRKRSEIISQKAMVTVGIDPGIDGAVAAYHNLLDRWIVRDCPTIKAKVGKSTKRVLAPGLMVDVFDEVLDGVRYDNASFAVQVFIEKVHAMQGQGVSSMFTFGGNFGAWQGIVAARGFPMTLVTPQAWKKRMMAGMGKDKDASRQRALQLFPHMRDQLKLKKHHGRADAMLIAEYGKGERT